MFGDLRRGLLVLLLLVCVYSNSSGGQWPNYQGSPAPQPAPYQPLMLTPQSATTLRAAPTYNFQPQGIRFFGPTQQQPSLGAGPFGRK